VTYSQKARTDTSHSAPAGTIIVLASAAVFSRVLLEIAVVAPRALLQMAPPLVMITSIIGVAAWISFERSKRAPLPPADREPPSTLNSAIAFGMLYAIVLLAVAAAREHFGEGALYAVAAFSGLTDVDAITLSTSNLVASGRLGPDTGWRLILVGALANLGFKAGIVLVAGGRKLFRLVLPYFGAAAVGAALLLAFWPDAAL
jgi:uncharacterized membrane protein (DUF4010 family)